MQEIFAVPEFYVYTTGIVAKERLDLTVEAEFKERARAMAKKRRRSISGLFEDLIEKETESETARIAEAPPEEKKSKRARAPARPSAAILVPTTILATSLPV